MPLPMPYMQRDLQTFRTIHANIRTKVSITQMLWLRIYFDLMISITLAWYHSMQDLRSCDYVFWSINRLILQNTVSNANNQFL